jgi:WD40 repeat protein
LEDAFSAGRDPILILSRSGGPQAWCDSLQIFPDGSSIYADNCRDRLLRLQAPTSRLEELNQLRSSFSSLDEMRQESEQTQRLLITGSGDGEVEPGTMENAWNLANTFHDMLSKPVGLGQTLVYLLDGRLYGYDVFNRTTQPATLRTRSAVHGITINQDSSFLAYADDSGVAMFNVHTGQTTQLLPAPENGRYQTLLWTNSEKILITHIPDTDAEILRLGWISVNQRRWNELPAPEGVDGFGCFTGLDQSPDGDQVAFTGLDYGAACNTGLGLTIVDLAENQAKHIVSNPISTGVAGGEPITAGGHTSAWSPDGTWIVFGLDQNALAPLNFSTRLYRVRPEGRDLTPLTNNTEGVAAYPVWAPDGKLYYALNGSSPEADGIYQYDPANNTHSLLIGGSNLQPLSISSDNAFMVFQQAGGLKTWGFLHQDISEVIEGREGSSIIFGGWIINNP